MVYESTQVSYIVPVVTRIKLTHCIIGMMNIQLQYLLLCTPILYHQTIE